MKIAISVIGNDLNAEIDPRFGRAQKFLIYDTTDPKTDFTVIDNTENVNASQGAGIQTAEAILKLGVNGIITGHCGPKAFRVLSTSGIKIYNCTSKTVNQALELLQKNELPELKDANTNGHWV